MFVLKDSPSCVTIFKDSNFSNLKDGNNCYIPTPSIIPRFKYMTRMLLRENETYESAINCFVNKAIVLSVKRSLANRVEDIFSHFALRRK